jgi:hypothetical protein
MRTFKIPFSYTVNGEIEIDGANLTHAINRFKDMAKNKSVAGHIPVLDKATKLNPDLDTFEINEDEAADLNPPTRYLVTVTRTEIATVEVEAHSDSDAERLALSMVESGECENDFEEESLEVSDIEEI